MQSAINLVINVILTIFGIILSFVGVIDGFLTSWMTEERIDPNLQLVIILVVTITFVIGALRFVGGLLGWLLLILLTLLLLHHAVPEMARAGWVPGLPTHL